MLLVEKVVKLLDDFHFEIFRTYVKNMSIRSYYPLALIDVVDRDLAKEQSSEYLFKAVYGEKPDGEKDMKKFFQLGHYTFKLTSYLARNYPDYLQPNLTRIQHFINSGDLEKALSLANILLDVSRKIEDINTEIKTLHILAQSELLLESNKQAIKYYQQISDLQELQKDFTTVNLIFYEQFKNKGKDNNPEQLALLIEQLKPFLKSKSFAVSILSRLNTCYALYLYKSQDFYKKSNFDELCSIEEELQKNDYILFPFLFNLLPKLSFLKLFYSIRELESEDILGAASKIIEESEDDLFWNSFINQPEINSIGIQTSYLVSNYFYSYRSDYISTLAEDIRDRILFLRNKCKKLLEMKMLQEKFVVRYINLSTVYAGLLLLGDEEDIKESLSTLDNLLLFYQQVPFHAFIDPIYTTMIMGGFCLKDFEKVEKSYRRYKKATKDKVVNPDNDLALHGFYYLTKWIETSRNQYIKKVSNVIQEVAKLPRLNATKKLLVDAANYYEMPLEFELLENNT